MEDFDPKIPSLIHFQEEEQMCCGDEAKFDHLKLWEERLHPKRDEKNYDLNEEIFWSLAPSALAELRLLMEAKAHMLVQLYQFVCKFRQIKPQPKDFPEATEEVKDQSETILTVLMGNTFVLNTALDRVLQFYMGVDKEWFPLEGAELTKKLDDWFKDKKNVIKAAYNFRKKTLLEKETVKDDSSEEGEEEEEKFDLHFCEWCVNNWRSYAPDTKDIMLRKQACIHRPSPTYEERDESLMKGDE